MSSPSLTKARSKPKYPLGRIPGKTERSTSGSPKAGVIPASFLQGLRDIAEGRVMDMEKALHEPRPR